MTTGHVLVAMMALCAEGCSLGTVAVLRYPWVEHMGLSLDKETLAVRVGASEVSVEAIFSFGMHGEQVDQRMFFPVPRGAEAGGFRVALAGEGLAPLELETIPGEGPGLSVGEDATFFDVVVPGEPLVAHGGVIDVSYVQQAWCSFSYIIGSGAYWRGPIGELEVMVEDPGGRVEEALVEGEPGCRVGNELIVWRFVDLEPRSGLSMKLACDGARQSEMDAGP